MTEQKAILELWKRAQAAEEEVCLATVVHTEGSSYRKPGARMLFTRKGQRVGTISGGCLETEIQKKAWWLSQRGPVIERYSSALEGDSEIPYGLACGGTVWVLLERGEQAARTLNAIADCVEHRMDMAILYALDSPQTIGTRIILRQDGNLLAGEEASTEWIELAQQTLEIQTSQCIETSAGLVFAEYMTPPQRLFVFGAGDDAQPVVQFAHTLGWQVTVADGRSHLATKARFSMADSVCILRPGEEALQNFGIGLRDAIVIMTHSYEQDRRMLQHVLPLDPAYLGVLGPRHRTEWLMRNIPAARWSGLRSWNHRVHTPAGLDLGAEGPAAIALSIIAEIQSVLARRIQTKQIQDRQRSANTLSAAMAT